MQFIDIIILIAYMLGMLGVGYYFHLKGSSQEDYYVGGRSIGKWHIGLSVVATDVGGGFSIGLGGLGFAIGLSGSWLLFTGLIGAWISAVFLIPRVKGLSDEKKFFSFPDLFGHFYGSKAAFIAALISVIGYLGFTSSQLLAGAKLASAAFPDVSLNIALIIMGFVAVVYTVMGGIKAVIYTDTVQWLLLMVGLIFIAIPLAYIAIGGWEQITGILPPDFLSFTNLSWQQFVNWLVTIIPIWFVGMTLYQRIYASRSEKEAKQAWFIAGLFEWPIMAMMGTVLGLMARVAFLQGMFAPLGYTDISAFDPEMGLPLLLKFVLPVGLTGIVLAAYLSAVLSTADSCLMASSSNLLHDILQKTLGGVFSDKGLFWSKILTLLLGVLAIGIAMSLEQVLSLMLYSYAFMVSGLLIPLIAAVFFKNRNQTAAMYAMVLGGLTTVLLTAIGTELPLSLDANVFGISVSGIVFLLINLKSKEYDYEN